MPTPSDDTFQLPPGVAERSAYTTCPPEHERSDSWRTHDGHSIIQEEMPRAREPVEQLPTPSRVEDLLGGTDNETQDEAPSKPNDAEQERLSTDGMSPMSTVADVKNENRALSPSPTPFSDAPPSSSSTRYKFSNIRQYPNHTSSFLRAGSKFRGTQQSDRQVYNVEVDIKHVDMSESFLCGYLRIEGLTEDHPTLTTYFEGEIVGPKYTFQTKHESWGATDKVDMQHWARFPAWRPLAKQAKKPDFHYKNCAQRENIFMRWKEYFLVPDHRVREIMGASFEGFYYICFNQVAGSVSGIYFHSKSERWQSLELKHVNDMGRLAAVEFR